MNQTAPSPVKTEWAALALSLAHLLGLASSLPTGVLLVALSLVARTLPSTASQDPLTLLLLGSGMFALGLLFLPGLVFNLRKFFNKPDWNLPRLPSPPGILYPLIALTLAAALILGRLSLPSQVASTLLLPVLSPLALGLPVLFYLLLALKGLPGPSARRGWSVFGAALLSSPFLALVFEIIAAVFIVGLYVLYASRIPGLLETFEQIGLAAQTASEETLLRMASTVLFSPGAGLAFLALFSVAVPLVEEFVKVAVLWFYAGKINSESEGFFLGVLCGAAFALSENVGFAATNPGGWVEAILIRATAATMHILASGLVGWGLASFWKKGAYGRLLGAYLAAVLLHGTWNAISILNGFYSLTEYVAEPPALLQSQLPSNAGWAILFSGALVGLVFFNRKMRKTLATEKVEYNPPLLTPNSEKETHGTS